MTAASKNSTNMVSSGMERPSKASELKMPCAVSCGHWYIFRYKALPSSTKEMLVNCNIEIYHPTRRIKCGQVGTSRVRYIDRPVVPGYIFVHAALQDALALGKKIGLNLWRKNSGAQFVAAGTSYHTVTDDAMRTFMRAVDVHSHDLKLLDASDIDLLKDDFVEICKGDFKGVRGHLKSVNGSSGGVVVVPLTDGLGESMRTLFHYGIPTHSSEISIISFAKGSRHATDAIRQAKKTVDSVMMSYAAGQKISGAQHNRLKGYVHRFGQIQLERPIQRANLALLMYRVYTILELTREREATAQQLEQEIFPDCQRRIDSARDRDKRSAKATYDDYMAQKQEADGAYRSRHTALAHGAHNKR